jgi:hypothetical protein
MTGSTLLPPTQLAGEREMSQGHAIMRCAVEKGLSAEVKDRPQHPYQRAFQRNLEFAVEIQMVVASRVS